MSRTDEIIKQLSEFDEEPMKGHFDRFEEKLRNHHRKISVYSVVLKIAAVFVLIMLSTSLIYYLKDQKAGIVSETAQNDEIREAGMYYTNLINSELGAIEKLAQQGIGSETEIMRVMKELSEMDHQFQLLEQDYNSNPDDERIRGAMIEYYQAKLDIINTIKSDWENASELKIRYNENIKS